MPSIHHLLNQLSPDSNTKGKQFEKITQWFLQNEPEWQAKIEKVWLWADYPDKWGKDRGIDLICQFKDGTHWGQCKPNATALITHSKKQILIPSCPNPIANKLQDAY